MSSISRIKANQMICTGSCLFVLASGVFGFGHVLGDGQHGLGIGSILSLGTPYWASLAVGCGFVLSTTEHVSVMFLLLLPETRSSF